MKTQAELHATRQTPDRRRKAISKVATTGAALLALCGLTLAQAAPQQHKTFGNPLTWQWAPSRAYHVVHYRIALHFNQAQGEVFGDEIVTLTPFSGDFHQFYLDSVGLDIDSVSLATPYQSKATVTPEKLQFIRHDPKLTILLPHGYQRGETLAVRVEYHGFPKNGLFFINPDKYYPNAPKEIWSQGEPEDNRFWYPSWDYPNDKGTSETIITVPNGQTAVSNGKLVSVEKKGGETTFHWVEKVPHSSYLNAVAIGPWIKVEQHYKNIPVDYYVPNYVSKARALRSFGLTPDMIAFYVKTFGVEYPYVKYAQTAVHNFTEGGMENISATTQTEWTLHSARADADFKSTGLVAHELAHQWFGDLVTTRSWSDIWLNEGFATFIEGLYTQHHEGNDAYRFEMHRDHMSARAEDNGRYRRPIVDHHYEYAMQMFDSTTYPKGASVLDMMRYVLGDKAFFGSLHHYLEVNREKAVDTADLMQAIREYSGQNLDWFFHEWIFMGGYPEYKVTANYDASSHMEVMSVEQTQKPDAVTPIFDMPVQLAFYGANGAKKEIKVRIHLAQQELYIPLSFQPEWVDFDPNDHIYKTVEFKKPVSELALQAEHDPAMMSQLWAVEQLGKTGKGDPEAAVAALHEVLGSTAYKAVRAAAATSLGEIGGANAKTILLGRLQDKENTVRAAAAAALAAYPKDQQVYDALVNLIHTDQSYLVESTSAATLGKLEMPQAFDVLKGVVNSTREFYVAAGAMRGVVATDHEGAIDVLLAKAQPGVPERERLVATELIGRLKDQAGTRRHQINELVRTDLNDNFSFVQNAAVRLVAELKLEQFRGALENLEASSQIHTQRGLIRASLAKMEGKPEGAAASNAGQIQELQQKVHDLSQQVQSLERREAEHPH